MGRAERPASFQQFINEKLDQALSKAHLPTNHPMRDALDTMAEVVGVREAAVRCVDAVGNTSSIDDMIAQLKADPLYRASIPAAPPKVAKNDMASLRSNFDRIAKGEIAVSE